VTDISAHIMELRNIQEEFTVPNWGQAYFLADLVCLRQFRDKSSMLLGSWHPFFPLTVTVLSMMRLPPVPTQHLWRWDSAGTDASKKQVHMYSDSQIIRQQ
jgi:hypothetical protein